MRLGSRSGYETTGTSAVHPPRAQTAGRPLHEAGAERVAALSALVEELSGQIDAIEGASRRETIRRGVRAAAEAEPVRRQAPPLQVPPTPAAPDLESERLGAIESRLAAIAQQIALRERPLDPKPSSRREEIGSLQEAIAEISARQKAIDRAGGRELPPVDTLALEDALKALRGDILALDRRIAQETQRGEAFGRSLRAEIAERTGSSGSDATEAALATLRGDLGAIREALELVARETTLASVESGYGHMIERLDDIVRRVPERGRIEALGRELARLAEKIDQAPPARAMEGELEDIRNAIASIAARRADDALDAQIRELREAIDKIGADMPGTRNLARIEERLDALAGRLDGSSGRQMAELGLAIEKLASRPRESVDLTRIERDIGAMRREIDGFAKGTDPVVLIRLEQQVAAIRGALEGNFPLHADPESGPLARLEQRLDALAGRLDALAELPGIAAPAADDALVGLRSEIAELRKDVVSREPARFDEIEDQMRGLMLRLDEASNRDDSQSLAHLEAQVGVLAEKLSSIEPGNEALVKVEANLDRLQALLADAHRESIETARTTARTAVEEFAGSLSAGREDELVAALREDLRRLQEAALHSDQQNQNTLEAVHDTLAKVVDRIAQLEAEDTASAGHASIRDRVRGATAPRAFPAAQFPEDHRPLAPGSGKPDLSAVARRPAVEADTGAPALPADRKADFIAAARRAAHAAQTETARARAEEREAASRDDDKSGPLARIGQVLRSRRRPLVLAIAAVVLAIGAAKFGPSVQQRIADVIAPIASVQRASDLDPVATGSIAAKPVRKVEPNRAVAAPSAAATEPAPGLVAPKGNSDAIAFSPDPFASYLDAVAPAAPTDATLSRTARTLDYARVEAAAADGDAAAAFEMGRHFSEPEVGAPDIKRAAEWYERSAKAGFALAQYRLGSLYERGDGVKLDVAAAKRWYNKASLAGNARATHNLAVLISEGADGKPDYKEAAGLFIVAANSGVADSQYNLGVLYARGLGVPVDLVKSYQWFALAAQQGDSEAGKRRDEVEKAMKPADLAAARVAVKAFQPKPLDPAANNVPTPDPSWYVTAGATSMTDRPDETTARTRSAS